LSAYKTKLKKEDKENQYKELTMFAASSKLSQARIFIPLAAIIAFASSTLVPETIDKRCLKT
jgi:hypothetical protein